MTERQKKFVKPGDGRLPRHPVTGARYNPSGEWVEYTPAIARQLRDGDIVETEPTPKKVAQPAAGEKKEPAAPKAKQAAAKAKPRNRSKAKTGGDQ